LGSLYFFSFRSQFILDIPCKPYIIADMKIQEYLDWKQLKWKDLAEKLGVDPTYMSRLKHGKVGWSPEMALKVEQITGGHVTKDSLVWGKGEDG